MLSSKTPACHLAGLQIDLEMSFRQQQQEIEAENQARVERIKAKMNQIIQAKKAHITVQEMNRVYDQVERRSLVHCGDWMLAEATSRGCTVSCR